MEEKKTENSISYYLLEKGLSVIGKFFKVIFQKNNKSSSFENAICVIKDTLGGVVGGGAIGLFFACMAGEHTLDLICVCGFFGGIAAYYSACENSNRKD